MARKNKKAGGRRFDTRLRTWEIIRILHLSPRQKIEMLRYMRKKLKGGEQID